MSTEGEKHAAELAKLEQRRKELEDALQRLARDEAEAQEVGELAQEVEQLEQLVETARAAANMEKTMTKQTDKLTRLAERRRKLHDALVAATDEEADAMIAEMTERLNLPKTDPNGGKSVSKAAAANRQVAEAQLDKLAKTMQQDGETFEKAYLRVFDTDIGKALMQARDDAQELERGGITSMDVVEARKRLIT